jgi:hypothetical protein
VIQRRERDPCAELESLRACRNRRQQHDRRRLIAIVRGMVFGHPGAFEADAFAPLDEVEDLGVQRGPGPLPELWITEIVKIAERELVHWHSGVRDTSVRAR